MRISSCDMIIEVVEDERDAAKDEIDFPKLKWLSLNELENLVCFYSGNYILNFPSLEELHVNVCPNMKIFSQGLLSVPKLQMVEGRYCKGDLNSTIQQLYKEKEHPKALTLIGKDIEQLCRGQIPDEPEVDEVKTLEIVKDKSTSIPVEILETFHNLENLKLAASSYKELFSCGNDDKRAGTFTQFKILEVLYCYNLTTPLASPTSFENLTILKVRYCNGLRSLLTSSTAKSLVQLQEMTISQCKMLTEVVANGGDVERDVVFRKLWSLSLDCLENLTSFCSGNYTFKFLSLNSLIVHNCPKMETFSRGVLSTPKLQKVKRNKYDFYGCRDYDLNTTIKQLQKMVVFPSMEYSKLRSLKKSDEKLWDIQLQMSTSSSYRNITCLIFKGFKKLKYVFPSSLVKSFEHLQQLEITNCTVLKEIVRIEEVETTSTFFFPRVTFLKLAYLLELTSFYPRKHTLEWPILRILEVYDCEEVKTFTSEYLSFHEDSEEAHSLLLVEKINPNLEALRLSEIDSVMTWQGPFLENFFCKLKRLEITFPFMFNKFSNVPIGILQRFKNLEMLKLHRIRSKEIFLCGDDEKTIGMPTHIKGLELDNCNVLEYLWKQDSKAASILQNLEVLEVHGCWKLINVVPSSASFQNLKVLTVANCWVMVNLVTSSAAKSLVQLTEMEIRECQMLIEIVENDQDGAEDEIIFTKLKWLSLEKLGSLTCFCNGKYTFKFPTLEELIVVDCPNIKTFCEGVLSTPRLQKVWEDKCLNIGSCSEGELNRIIQQLHINMVDQFSSYDWESSSYDFESEGGDLESEGDDLESETSN